MKARVKATGEIVEIVDIDFDTLFCKNGGHYTLEQLEGIECEPDYWTRLEHQAAIAAMQGLMTILPNIGGLKGRTPKDEIVDIATSTSHALVEKLKEKEERK